jgi:predicted enzyme related to lactoylglutathione lyase
VFSFIPTTKVHRRSDFDDGTAHIALEVSSDDFDKAADELKKAGVKVLIDEPVVRPTGKAIYFFDPEMNYIQLWSRP